ncbi:MFS quinate transporter QutD [Leucosporidium creatinivorum]|uniref:Quinate transporter n=1 Tax=Leucosporidium creatinivorum TaxID=106004 RepID=A0A1Y2CRZ0_9BASI|nr:MFS quinate transporter QutD [Leucosporidium creatinivorum]
MVGLAKVEDRPTPPQVYNARVYLASIVAACAAIMIGYDSAFIGTSISLDSFKDEFGLDTKTTSEFNLISENIVSVYQAGAFFGSLIGYPIGTLWGRKWGLLISALVFTLGSGIMLASKSSTGLGPIYAGRVLAGLGIGAASNLTPLYISEIAPPAIRGQLIGMYEIAWQIGGLVGFWINYGITQHIGPSTKQWIIPFAVQLIPGGLFAIGIPLFIKESPRWLISRNRRDEAIKNLSYLRKLDAQEPYIIEEINAIDIQVEHDATAVGTGFWAPFRQVFGRWHLARRLIIVTTLFLHQNGTGINAINYYSPTIFKSLGVTGGNTSLLTTGIFGVMKTIFALLWSFFLIDRWGRRPLLILGSLGGSVSMAYLAAYIAIGKPQERPVGSPSDAGGRAALGFFYIWTAFYSVSWNGTPWVINAESFPGSVRTVTQTLAATSNWFWNFIIARFTPTMFSQMGYGVYIFFCLMQVLAIVYVVFLLPETKNVPLEEMDRLWVEKNAWTANKKVMAELQRERQTRDGPPALIHQEKPNGGAEEAMVENAGRKEVV